MGINPKEVKYLEIAKKAGLGENKRLKDCKRNIKGINKPTHLKQIGLSSANILTLNQVIP